MHSLDPILRPTSIAVIGASRQPNTIGWQILDNLLRHGFEGPVYPVNPNAHAIHSIPAYASIRDVPGPVDLAIIVVPKEQVMAVAKDCIDASVRGLVVISAGFKEVGGDGVDRERELVDLVRGAGVRMVGPNCMGVINTDPSIRMNATFAPSAPSAGGVAFMSQSGALGVSILDTAESLGIGVSSFVSAGNKADVSGNDLLEFWRDDPGTKVILMYLEGIGNAAKFVDLAREVSRKKPICIVKSGRSSAGARAAASHTGAMAGTDLAIDGVFAQAGVVRADTVNELFDVGMAFANQPLPRGNRVAIVTNAGGPGIIIADACEAEGLDIVRLTAATEAHLRTRLPEEASVHNPVDLIASATAASYEFALEAVLADPNIDAAVAAFVPPLGIHARDVAQAIVQASSQHRDKPVMAVLMGRQGLPAGLAELQDASVPGYIYPESAARALATMWRQRRWMEQPEGRVRSFEADDEEVRSIITRARRTGQRKLDEPEALAVLEAYGIPVAPYGFVGTRALAHDAEALMPVAERLGYPVAVKVVSADVVHKSDVGGVVTHIANADELLQAVREMRQRLSTQVSPPKIAGFLVQKMVSAGIETIVGVTRVPRLGSLALFGLGGVFVEVMRDVALRLCPVRDVDAEDMLASVQARALLEGARGQAPRDKYVLVETIERISQLAVRHPEIVELDINPLVSYVDGAVAVDARVVLSGTDAE